MRANEKMRRLFGWVDIIGVKTRSGIEDGLVVFDSPKGYWKT